MKKNKLAPKLSYEPEADVLSYEVGEESIDHAEEVGNVVVHFSKTKVPVLIEILEASIFTRKTTKLLSHAGVRLPMSV